METKVCVVCNTEKSIDNLYNKYRECKPCKIKRSTRRYFENKGKISNQQKIYYKKMEMCYLQGLKYINKTENLIHNK